MSSSPRRRAGLALALTATLALGLASGATAAPKAVPAPPAVAAQKPASVAPAPKPAAQVQLRINAVDGVLGAYVATVTVKAPANAAVEGAYQLLDNGVVVAEGVLTGGQAVVSLGLVEGLHALSVVYSGSSKINGAGSKVVVVDAPVVAPEPAPEVVA